MKLSDSSNATATSAKAGQVIALTSVQKHAGAQMLQSITTVPQFSMSIEINASAMLAKIDDWPDEKEPSFTVFFVKSVSETLESFPLLNASLLSDDNVRLHPQLHVAIMVNTAAGLMLPVLRNVAQTSLAELHHEFKRLLTKAEHEGLSADDTEGATFTIANLGMFGISEFTALIYPPQVAILTAGAIAYRLVMTGNRIINLPFFTVTVTVDQRVIDGVFAAKFLQRLKEDLEE